MVPLQRPSPLTAGTVEAASIDVTGSGLTCAPMQGVASIKGDRHAGVDADRADEFNGTARRNGRRAEVAPRWNAADADEITLVQPTIIVEFHADRGQDRNGQWRHPVRYLRARPDLEPGDAPPTGAGTEPVSC